MDELEKGARVNLRPSQVQRRRWEEAAAARGIKLTEWMYRTLDVAAERQLLAQAELGRDTDGS